MLQLMQLANGLTIFACGKYAKYLQEVFLPNVSVKRAIYWLHKHTQTKLFTLHSCEVNVPPCEDCKAYSDNETWRSCDKSHGLPPHSSYSEFCAIIGDEVLFDTITTDDWTDVWDKLHSNGCGDKRTLWILAPHIDSTLYRLHVQLNNTHVDGHRIHALVLNASGLELLEMLGCSECKHNPFSLAATIAIKNSIAAARLVLPPRSRGAGH